MHRNVPILYCYFKRKNNIQVILFNSFNQIQVHNINTSKIAKTNNCTLSINQIFDKTTKNQTIKKIFTYILIIIFKPVYVNL